MDLHRSPIYRIAGDEFKGRCTILKVFKEGQRRLRIFGVDSQEISNEDISQFKGMVYATNMAEMNRNNFYSIQKVELMNISTENEIDYAVMKKKYFGGMFRSLPQYMKISILSFTKYPEWYLRMQYIFKLQVRG